MQDLRLGKMTESQPVEPVQKFFICYGAIHTDIFCQTSVKEDAVLAHNRYKIVEIADSI